MGSRLCTNCGRELFPATGETPTEPVAPSPDIWSAYSSEATEEAPRSPRALPPPAAPAEPRSVPAAPTADDDPPPPPPPVATAGRSAVTPREPARPSRTPQILGLLAGAALVVAVLGLVLATRSDDGSSGIVSDSPASSAPPLPATSTMTGPTGTVVEDDAPDPIAPTVPATTSATTLPTPETAATAATTLPPVQTELTPAPTAPVTVPATPPPTPVTVLATTPPATDAPSVIPAPAPSVTLTTGANVLADPLPSGVSSADVGPSLTLTQQFSDALAAGDWESARRLNPSLRGLSDAEFEDGYGGLDRATQLLVDAQQTPSGDRLLLVTIANERAGAQTTLYCVESTVSVEGAVRQTAASVLERYPGTIGVADVTSDPAITDLIRRQCALT